MSAQRISSVAVPGAEAALERLEVLRKQVEQLQNEIETLKKQLQAEPPHASLSTVASPTPPPDVEEPGPPASRSGSLTSLPGRIDLSGFVDAYYGYNFNHPVSRLSNLRAFDAPDNQFALNLIEIVLSKTPDSSNNRLGFRFSLGFGNAINSVNGVDPGGLGYAQYIHEGYMSYVAPIGKGLQLDVGKFASTFGTEVIETKDNWNYSRGLLFTYAGPAYHLGLRTKYAFGNKYAVTGYLVNGWNNLVDNNTGKSVGFSFAWTPNRKWAITQNYMGGPEQPDCNNGWRQLADTVVSYSLTDRIALGLNYDYGRGDRVLAYGRPADWTGVASYMRYNLGAQYAIAARYEYYADVNGFTTGTAQHINELTTTFERNVAHDLIVRMEFRRDVGNVPTFSKGDAFVKSQNTLTGGLVYLFDAREIH